MRLYDVAQHLDATLDFRELQVVDLPEGAREPRGDLGHACDGHVVVLVAGRMVDPHREHLGVLGAQLLQGCEGHAHEGRAYAM